MIPKATRVLVVGGFGTIGSMFAARIGEYGCPVRIVDPRHGLTPDDILSPNSKTQADLAWANIVILAVDENVAIPALPIVHKYANPECLVVDTTSTKVPIVPHYSALGPRPSLSINPMFGSGLHPDGRAIACVIVADGPRVSDFLELLRSWGSDTVLLQAEEHDRIMAVTQVLTHTTILAFGITLARVLEQFGNVSISTLWRMAPPPHQTMLQLLARLTSLPPGTYSEIQRSELAPSIRRYLEEAVSDAVSAGSDANRLGSLLATASIALEPSLGDMRTRCQEMFEFLAAKGSTNPRRATARNVDRTDETVNPKKENDVEPAIGARDALTYLSQLEKSQRVEVASDEEIGGGNALRRALAISNAPDEPFILSTSPIDCPDGRIRSVFSHRDLMDLVDAWSTWYASKGIGPRDRVGVFLADTFAYWIHFQALAQLGAIGVLINSNAPQNVAQSLLQRTQAVGLYADRPQLDRLHLYRGDLPDLRWVVCAEDVPKPPPSTLDEGLLFKHADSDPVVILHSSGTTGNPKAVVHTHRSIAAGPKFRLTDHEEKSGSLMMTALPQSHLGCIAYMTYAVLAGSPTVAASDLPGAELSKSISLLQPTSVMAFGHAYSELANTDVPPGGLDSVEVWVSMGDAVHHSHITALLEKRSPELPSAQALDRLGTSELGWGVLLYVRERGAARIDRCGGHPTGSAEVAVLDADGLLKPVGEVGFLAARGPSITPGYWNDWDTTVRSTLGGFWLTGDMAYKDSEGRFFQVDRAVDVVTTDEGPGYSVLMEEILLAEFKSLRECAVVQGSRGGKTYAVAICEVEGDVGPEEFRKTASEVLRRNGHPGLGLVDIFDDGRAIPLGVTGKVLKRELRARYSS